MRQTKRGRRPPASSLARPPPLQVERSEALGRFTDHTSDVMSVAPCPEHPALFVSGSTDSTAKAWDLRSGKCTQTFVGHESDINAVAYMRHGQVRGILGGGCLDPHTHPLPVWAATGLWDGQRRLHGQGL